MDSELLFDIADQVARTAEKFPDRIAVIEPDKVDKSGKRTYKKYTYSTLASDSLQVARGLMAMGIGKGTRIVAMTPPSYESCVITLALHKVGALIMMIDPSVGYKNVSERLGKIGPEAFVGIPIAHLARVVFGWGPRFPKQAIVINGKFPAAKSIEQIKKMAREHTEFPKISPHDEAIVLYTTGSTGPAKPSLYLHKNYAQLYKRVAQSWRFSEDSESPVDLAIFPAFFLIALSGGGTVVVPPIKFPESPAKTDPKALLDVINDCGVKTCFASPVILENMASYAVENGIKTKSLRRIIGGGAPIYERVSRRLLEMMDGRGEVFANYGATEAMPSTEMSAKEAIESCFSLTAQGRGLCVGRALDGVELRIIAIEDSANSEFIKDMPVGEIGEILVRSMHISPAYYKDPLNTQKNKIEDEGGQWHRLGDAGYIDTEGRLWTCGRVSQRVRTREGFLFPLMVEPVFDADPAVKRSGLVGVEIDGYELPVICVEVNQKYSAEECEQIREKLQQRAENFEASRPVKHILFIEKLPVDPRHNSKIERPKLKKWATEKIKKRDK